MVCSICVVLAAASLGQTDTSSPKMSESVELNWQLKQGDTLYQELVTQQQSVFRVQGLLFQTGLQYRILSRYTVERINEDGNIEVRQKIEEAKLLQADPLTQSLVLPQLNKMPGTEFTIHFNKKMEVTEFQAPPIQAAVGRNALGLQMASLLDRDGWKEMAELSFFQPNRPVTSGSHWERDFAHHWGELGKWSGKNQYRYEGSKDGLHKIAYGLKLAHQAAKGGGNLVGKAAFQAQAAHGNIYFNDNYGKVVGAEERFHVRGALEINFLGQKTPVEMEEVQTFNLRLVNKK